MIDKQISKSWLCIDCNQLLSERGYSIHNQNHTLKEIVGSKQLSGNLLERKYDRTFQEQSTLSNFL